MPKTRDAFALVRYFKTVFDPTNYNFRLEFDEFFKAVIDSFVSEGSVILPSEFSFIEDSIIEIEKITKCHIEPLGGFGIKESDVGNAEKALKKTFATLGRFDRHIQRISDLKTSKTYKKDELISKYDYAVKVLNLFYDALTSYYFVLVKRYSKSFVCQVGRRIRISRQLKGLSQESVAKSIGVAAITLSTWERGEREPPLYSILQLSRVLDVSLDFLFGNSEKSIK